MKSSRYDYALLVGGFLAFWQLLHWAVGPDVVSSPRATIARAVELLGTPTFWGHVNATLTAFVLASVISIAGGIAIGLWLGLRRFAGDVADPILGTLYSIPKITLYPIILLVFGLGMSAKIAFGAIHGIIPVALFTLNAVRSTKPILVKTGRVLKLSPPAMVRSILFPAAVPEIFTGLRVGFSLTLIGTVLGEMFAAQHGLGYLLMNAIGLYNVDVIMSVTFLLVVFAAGVNGVLLAVDRRLHFRA